MRWDEVIAQMKDAGLEAEAGVLKELLVALEAMSEMWLRPQIGNTWEATQHILKIYRRGKREEEGRAAHFSQKNVYDPD